MYAKLWPRSSASSTQTEPSPASSPMSPGTPALALSPSTHETLERLADAALQDAMLRYQAFREQLQRRVPSDQWRQVKRLANLVAYRERPAWRRREGQQRQLLRSIGGPSAATAKAVRAISDVDSPNVLVVGSLQGTLDDEMYGCMAASDQAARMRSSYVDDSLRDLQWLATLRTPTREQPFRNGGVARAVVVGSGGARRELCFVASMGLTHSSAGERVGYYVLQSVPLELAPAGATANDAADTNASPWRPRRRLVRASITMCWLKCELREPAPRLELFAHGSLSPRGGGLGVGGLALRIALGLAMTSDVAPLEMHGDCMGQCKAPFGPGSKSLARCVICQTTVCRSCRVDRRVTIDVSVAGVQQVRCGVCVLCMARAQQSSAAAFAAREVAPSPQSLPLPPSAVRQRRATATSAPVRAAAGRLTAPTIAVL